MGAPIGPTGARGCPHLGQKRTSGLHGRAAFLAEHEISLGGNHITAPALTAYCKRIYCKRKDSRNFRGLIADAITKRQDQRVGRGPHGLVEAEIQLDGHVGLGVKRIAGL